SENRFWPDKGQTALTDIGSYVVQFAIWAFKERPLKITAVGKTTENGSDLWASIVLEFSNGGKATLMYSCVDHSPNSAVISLSEGYIQIPEFFWCPERLIVHKGPLTWKEPLPKPQEFLLNDDDGNYNFNNSSGLRYEIDHVHECLKKNLKQSPIHNFDESLKTLEILDEIRRQIGVVYGQD
uniref:Gfo/Idh/MocA-like oxidoreductase C-terminal domain-containing protein n=1 Tax=Panagrolaimus sp. JU765 TaxID=591449 RepID=A0AC34QV16_9BILA